MWRAPSARDHHQPQRAARLRRAAVLGLQKGCPVPGVQQPTRWTPWTPAMTRRGPSALALHHILMPAPVKQPGKSAQGPGLGWRGITGAHSEPEHVRCPQAAGPLHPKHGPAHGVLCAASRGESDPRWPLRVAPRRVERAQVSRAAAAGSGRGCAGSCGATAAARRRCRPPPPPRHRRPATRGSRAVPHDGGLRGLSARETVDGGVTLRRRDCRGHLEAAGRRWSPSGPGRALPRRVAARS